MSAFLFYKPDSNPSRFSRKERFSLHLTSNSTTAPGNAQGDEDCLYDTQYTWASTPNLCGMQSNGSDPLTSLSLPPNTENACNLGTSERELREISHFLSNKIDHHHLSSISSVEHARPLLTERSVPTVEQNCLPQGNIGNIEDPTPLHGFDEELEPLWNSVNGSKSPPTSLQPLPRTHAHNLPLAHGIQESTKCNTTGLSLSTGRVFDAQHSLRLDEAQQKTDDPMQLDCPVEQSLGDSECVKHTQSSLVDDSAPAESESETGSMWSENQNLMLNTGPPSPRTPCEGPSVINDADGGPLDQPSEEYRYTDSRSTACQDTMVEIQSSISPKKAANSARTIRLDRCGCSGSSDHARLGRSICHSNEITSDDVPEKSSALHHFARSAGTEFDMDPETDQIERISLPSHTQPNDGPNLTEPILHSHRTRNKKVVFSHVEIRNPKKADNESARLTSQCDGLHPENTSPIPFSNPHNPWRLSGTTLSIDTSKAERLPIAVGYSAFRVVDGQLFQILTLSQGNVELRPAKGPMRDSAASIYSAEIRKRSNRMWSSAKRRPLSPTEKRKLVALRDNGYTWNEIATRFPQRKKGTLQSIYYSQMKSTRDRITLAHEDLRRRRSACNSRHSILSGESASTSISADRAQSELISHPRYCFRPRR